MKLAALLLLTASALAQPPAPLPSFDVASVRPSKSDTPQHSTVPLDSGNVYGTVSPEDARDAAGGLFIVTHQALWRYIVFAYRLAPTQEMALRFSIYSGVPKSGAPFWVTGSFDASPEFWDISARAPAGTSIDQMRLMMRSLLADRFHLALHFATADAPVFALALVHPGATGPNLQPHPASDTCTSNSVILSGATAGSAVEEPALSSSKGPASKPATAASAVGALPPACGVIAHVPSPDPGQHYGGRAVPLSLIASSIPTMTGLAATPRPVIDQTGLTGPYDFTLHWIHDPSGDAATSENIDNFRDALKKQLGLELRSSHAPMEFLIVDHVDHPSEN